MTPLPPLPPCGLSCPVLSLYIHLRHSPRSIIHMSLPWHLRVSPTFPYSSLDRTHCTNLPTAPVCLSLQGLTHFKTLNIVRCLGNLLQNVGLDEEAMEYYTRALAGTLHSRIFTLHTSLPPLRNYPPHIARSNITLMSLAHQ